MSAPNPLVAVMFSTLAAEMADPDRFRRGRNYVRDHAVGDVDIRDGLAVVDVQGSRSQPYVVTIRVRGVRRAAAAAAGAGKLNAIVPRPDDLTISCSCPDWGDPCKHGVAALLALGEACAADPSLLATFRMTDREPLPDDEPTRGRTHLTLVPPAPDPLDEFFGRDYEPGPVEALPPRPTKLRTIATFDDAVELTLPALDSARAALARAFGHS